MKKPFCIFFCVTVIISLGLSQNSADIHIPDVNQSAPAFELRNLKYYSKEKISFTDLKGKHIILDFFTAGCSACFESFPKLKQLQEQFGPQVQIFLIGWNVYNLSETYEKFRVKQKLVFPVSYDSLLFKKFGVDGVPYLVWVDDRGIIKAITTSTEATVDNISAFVQNKPFHVRNTGAVHWKEIADNFDSAFILNLRPFLNEKSMGASSLVSWTPDMPISYIEDFKTIGNHRFYQISGIYIDYLINIAFTGDMHIKSWDSLYGKLYTNPIFEMDSSHIPILNYSSGEGIFCYSLITSPTGATKEFLQRKIRADLENYLDYDIKKETRMMPCWRLIAKPGALKRLKSKHQNREITGGMAGAFMHHVLISDVIKLLFLSNQNDPPFIDETGIQEYIDIDLDALTSDFEEVKKALYENGLELIRGTKLMQVLVVRDRDQVN